VSLTEGAPAGSPAQGQPDALGHELLRSLPANGATPPFAAL
jgi:hypothetical protein